MTVITGISDMTLGTKRDIMKTGGQGAMLNGHNLVVVQYIPTANSSKKVGLIYINTDLTQSSIIEHSWLLEILKTESSKNNKKYFKLYKNNIKKQNNTKH